MARTFWPVVAPLRLISHELPSSRSWKERTFSIATRKLSSTSGESVSLASSIWSTGTRTGSGHTPSNRSVYSKRALSPLSRTSATMRRAALRTFSERNPPGRRSRATSSPRSASRASSTLTKRELVPFHGICEGGYLLVAEAIGAAVGYKAGGGGGDLVQDHQMVLTEGRSSRRKVHDALGEPYERGELYGAVERDDLRLPSSSLEVSPRGAGILGRHPHNLRVLDRLADIRDLFRRGRQYHTTPPRSQVPQLHHVRLLLLQHILAHDADVRRPVLYEDRHVRGPAHDKLRLASLVDQLAAVLPQHLHRQPGPLERPQSVLKDGALRHRHP